MCAMTSENGYIELTKKDRKTLGKLLAENNGSKDKIKVLRKWILERAHSLEDISCCIEDFAREQNDFKTLLYTLYIMNDVLFNSANANMFGPYTKDERTQAELLGEKVDVLHFFMKHAGSILYHAYNIASDDESKGKEQVTAYQCLCVY